MGVVSEFNDRWRKAREGAKVASDYLAKWLRRWTDAGRKVLVVAFSLGTYVAWNAIQQVPSENIELIMISGAVVDRPERWEGMERLGRVFNVYSRDDWALKLLYPYGVGADETPAAGLGPLTVSELPNVTNVDVTDMIGRDHLWASQNVQRLIEVAMGCYWGGSLTGDRCYALDLVEGRPGMVPATERQRLYRWLVVDPELWRMLGVALDGHVRAQGECSDLDRWSLGNERLWSLLDAGIAARMLYRTKAGPVPEATADRSLLQLRGVLRRWLYDEEPSLQPGDGVKGAGSG
jgi:pimeloyl-ACP methyl ester carboxylesterase